MHPLAHEHGREILELERSEVSRLYVIYEEARLELLGRLTELDAETFTAQQMRLALIQVEAALRVMLRKLHDRKTKRLEKDVALSIEQVSREIAHFEPEFRQSQGKIQTAALRKLATPRGLLLEQFDRSMATYGGHLVGEIHRRLAVHMVKKSSVRDVAIDIAGRLEAHAFRGARWRAERIVRTELIDALATGHQAALEAAAAEIPGLKRQWSAALDSRTSSLCLELDGRVRELGEAFGEVKGRPIVRPPAHPLCRSRVTPWRKEWFDGK